MSINRFWALFYILFACVDIWVGINYWHRGHYGLAVVFFLLSLWFVSQFNFYKSLIVADALFEGRFISTNKLRKIEAAAKEAKTKLEDPLADPKKIQQDLIEEVKRIRKNKDERP